MSAQPWLLTPAPTGYPTTPSQRQDAQTRIAGAAPFTTGAIAWSLTHSTRPDLLTDAMKEARRG